MVITCIVKTPQTNLPYFVCLVTVTKLLQTTFNPTLNKNSLRKIETTFYVYGDNKSGFHFKAHTPMRSKNLHSTQQTVLLLYLCMMSFRTARFDDPDTKLCGDINDRVRAKPNVGQSQKHHAKQWHLRFNFNEAGCIYLTIKSS